LTSVVKLKVRKRILLLLLVTLFLLPSVIHTQVNAPTAAFPEDSYARENQTIVQKVAGALGTESIAVNQQLAKSVQESTGVFQGGVQMLRFSSFSNSNSFTRYIMCKDYDSDYNPIDPTTIFSPSDTKAVCLTTATINRTIEFEWYYRSNSSKAWVSCWNYSRPVELAGEWSYEGHLWIAGYGPGAYYPRAYRVDVYLDDIFSFSDFFEVTNGGLNSPRTCEGIDANGYPVNLTSRFTIGTDTNAYYYLRFDRIAYFNEELKSSHNFTTIWIQPNGSRYKSYTGSFTDYKDIDVTSNYWKYNCTTDDYIQINSTTPVGNWKVEVYLDNYCLNGSWVPYGPLATTPFIVGNESVPDWTFMMYLDGDNPGETACIETFLKAASIGSSSQVNIIVEMDRTTGWWESGEWKDDTRFGNWTDCKRFYVTTNMTSTPDNATLDLGEVDMGDPETLKNFVNWTIDHYPANHYSLALWDHGAGFMGLCVDVTNNDFISLPKLSQALNGLPAIMDVTVVDACSMAMAEVAYQIKDFANIMVSPEGLGYAPAPYNMYLSALTSNPSMSPNVLATEVVNDYLYWCTYERALGNYQQIQNATMSAIDLTRIMSLSAAINDFALKLKDKETTNYEQISQARDLTEEYPGPYEGNTSCYIDLYNFAQLINISTSQYALDEELGSTASQVMTAVSESTIVAENISLPNAHGLAIFFPSDKARYDNFESNYGNTAFATDTAWNEFLQYHLSGCLLTIQTTPPYPHISVTFANNSYTTDAYGKVQVFVLPSYQSVNVTAFVLTGPGSRGAFTQWEDGTPSNSRTLFVNGTTTLTAEYETQYQLIINANFGTTNPSVGAKWCNASTTFPISAAAPPLVFSPAQERYVLLGWNGTGSDSYSGTDISGFITMNGPINETFTWRHECYLTVGSLYGSPTPSSGWINAGTSIPLSVTPPTSEPTDTRHVCTGWNGTGSVSAMGTGASANITITEPSSITWNWKTQYCVYVYTDPAGLNPQPNTSSPGPWCDEGTVLTCTAQNVSGKVFDHWTVGESNYEPGLNPINVTVYGPYTATAHYLPTSAWWDNLLAPQNLPFTLTLFVVLSGSLVGGALVKIRRNRIKKTYPETAPIKVPKIALPGRVATGYEDVDNLLYGGIPHGYAIALTSPSCDERDLLIKRFLETGAKKGDVTFYVTIDPGELRSLAEEFQSSFYLFVCNPRADTMVESLPNVFKLKGVENLTEIFIALTKAFRAFDAPQSGPRRACVEIVSDVLLQHHALQTRRWLIDLVPELRSKGFTTLAVVNVQMHPAEEVQAILDIFEGQIAIYEKDTGTGPLRFLRVKKMTNQKYLECELTLRKESLEPQNREQDS